MAQNKWLILPPTSPKISPHKNNIDARARAHAAKVSHLRRKNKTTDMFSCEQLKIPETAAESEQQSNESHALDVLSPRAIVDNARKEPFQVWSVDLLDQEHELVDTHINVCALSRNRIMAEIVGLPKETLWQPSQLDGHKLVSRYCFPASHEKCRRFPLRRAGYCCSS